MKRDESPDGFLSRWARRKQQARSGVVVAPEPPEPVEAIVAKVAVPGVVDEAPAVEPLPTLADVALLTRESDYSRFVARGVDDGVKQAAMKKLFTDPHFNVMDGLDTYIDDYGKADPIPLAMLRRMTQSKVLRLFDDDEDQGAEQVAASAPDAGTDTGAYIEADLEADLKAETRSDLPTATDDHADLRLQQDPAAGRPGADPGAGA